MPRKYPSIAFTPSVEATQRRYGSDELGARLKSMELDDERLSENEAEFVRARDGFYMATVNEDGWPYVQYRGGPRGFLAVLDERTLAFADLRGNRQYVSVGNLAHDARVALFLMDYPNRRRLKLMARAEVFEAAERPELAARLPRAKHPAPLERIVLFHVVAFDWNCSQHITPRYSEEDLGGEFVVTPRTN